MRIYMAGTIHDPLLQDTYKVLVDLGHEIVSRWHLPGNRQTETQAQDLKSRATIADTNRADLLKADALLALPCDDHHLRGLHYEIGFAHGHDIPVYVLGTHTDLNTMTLRPDVTYICSLLEIPRKREHNDH